MYHGSPVVNLKVIRAPRPQRIDQLGIWLTSDPKMAQLYGEHVYEVFTPECPSVLWVSVEEDPYFIPSLANDFLKPAARRKLLTDERNDVLYGEKGLYRNKRYAEAVRQHLLDEGYCALLWPDAVEFDGYPGKADVMLVLEPREIPVRQKVR